MSVLLRMLFAVCLTGCIVTRKETSTA